MASWYYEESGDEIGPLSPAEMRERVGAGAIAAHTRVRRDDGDWITADRVPGLLANAPPARPENAGDPTGGLIPYKNPSALIAYYLGILSLIPCVGVPIGIGALVLGVIGLKSRNANPAIKGTVHAWIGIVLGGLMALVWLIIAAVAIVSANATW